MKKTSILLPLACIIPVLFSPAQAAQEQPWRVEPVVSVRHSEQGPDAWYLLGRQHQDDNRLDLAAEAYRHALAGDAAHIEARNALATVYAQQGRHDEAIAEFETLLRANGKLAHVHNNLGYVHLLKTDYAKAAAAFGQALAIEPDNARAIGNLALANAGLARPVTTEIVANAVPAAAAPAEPTAEKESAAAQESTAVAQADGERPSLAGLVLEISNGTRDARLGEYLAEALRREGATVTRVAGLKPYTQRRNVIFYRDGFHDQAVALSRSFAVPPALVNNSRSRDASDKADIRLVLGKSALQTAEAAAGASGQAF